MSPEPMGEFFKSLYLDLSCCEASYNHQSQVITVETSSKGHLGSRAFVLFSKVALWWEVRANMHFIAPSRPNNT